MLAAEPTREVLWLVRSGALKVVRLQHDGTETVVDFRLPGELVAATPAPSRESAAHITALTETTVCRLVPPDTASAAALAEYWRLVATSMQQQWERALEPWPSLPAFERVARFLADLSKRLPHEQRDGTFELPMTRAELGSRLGLTEETVCRALRKLQTTKRIHVAGRHVRLLPEAT
jgi:CRP/FNR family transcriptional regulator